MELVHVRPHRSRSVYGRSEMVHGYDRVQPMHPRRRRTVRRRVPARAVEVVALPVRRRRTVRRRRLI